MILMVKLHKVRITVLKRLRPSEVFETNPATPLEPLGACEMFTEGQAFVVNPEEVKMPEDFCSGAWHSIYCNVRTLAFGGNLPWYREKGVAINCCPDGLRPVIFKLERI